MKIKKWRKIISLFVLSFVITTSLPIEIFAESMVDRVSESSTDNNETQESENQNKSTDQNNGKQSVSDADNKDFIGPIKTGESQNANDGPNVEVREVPEDMKEFFIGEKDLHSLGSYSEQEELAEQSKEWQALKKESFGRSATYRLSENGRMNANVARYTPDGTWYTHDIIVRWQIDGEDVFCIQEGVFTEAGINYEAKADLTAVQGSKSFRLSLIGYFGYYSQRSMENYALTQMMIWDEFGGSFINYGVIGMSKYNTFKSTVNTAISNYSLRPSWHNTKIQVKAGETVRISDTTNRFASWNGEVRANTAGVRVEKSGNDLLITATASSNTDGAIQLNKHGSGESGVGTAYAYTHGSAQDLARLYLYDPLSAHLNIEVLKEGHAEVLKVDEDTGKPLANATYRFTTSTGQTKELTTGADGKARWENLLVDTKVTIEEIRAPHGYILNAQPQTLTIRANETTTLRFNNKEQLANLTVIKEDEETGNKPQGAATLFGAKYELTDSEGKSIAILTLEDVDGLSQAEIKGLKLGTYYLKEVEAPEGYNLDPETHEVQLTYAGQNETVAIHSKTVNDRVIKGGIEGYKFGSKDLTPSIMGNIRSFFRLGQKEEEKSSKTTNQDIKPPLEGVELTATSKTTGLKYTATTDKKGYFHIGDLSYDTYTVEETKGAPGYLLIEPFEVTITEEGYVHFYLLEDRIIEARLRILKEDAETGERIPLAGTSFKIWDRWGNDGEGAYVSMRENNSLELTDTFVTNDEGEIVTSEMLAFGEDRYELREIRAPEGYILPTEPVVFSVTGDNANGVITLHVKNDPQKGLVTVNKSVETAIQTSVNNSEYGEYTQFDFDQLKGQGFRFKIEAAEDVVTPDGTVRFKQGETIQFDGEDYILETTEDGSATSPAFLYIGSYYLVEIGAPAGVAMLEEPVPFSIEYAGQEVEVSTSEVDVDNFLQEINVYGQKDQEVVVDWADGQAVIEVEAANNGQVFALRLAKGLTVGESALEEDTTLAYTVVKEGVIAFEGLKLPNQTIQMYLQEVDAGSDHVLSEAKYFFTYEPETNEQTHDIHVSAKPTEMEESEEEPAEEDENNEETDTEADQENENDSENPEADTDVSEEQDNDSNETEEAEQEDAEEETDAILNKLARANVKVIKTDGMDQKALQGVEFDLIRIGEFKPIDSEPEDETTEGEEEQSPEEDGTEESDTETPETFTDDVGDTEETRTVIGTYVTDENGEITIEDLPTGQYVLVETKPLEWYHENDEEYDFEISAENNGETILFEVENSRLDLEIETLFAETETGSKVVDPTVDNKLTDYAWTLGGKEGHEYFVVTQFINGATEEVVDKGISSFISTGEEEQELLFDVMIPANTMKDGDELVATHMVYSDEELTDLVSDHFDLQNKEQTVSFAVDKTQEIPQAGSFNAWEEFKLTMYNLIPSLFK